jgi:SAM-dependent methyltransferase
MTSHYDANYADFAGALHVRVREEAFGEDIGQNSWLTNQEQDEFLAWLNLDSGKYLLDVGCGAGGPALRVAAKSGCSLMGIDIHHQAVATANRLASERGLTARAEFRVVDAGGQLPFADAVFDAITCIDAINHLPDRPRVLGDWHRLLKPGGRLLFTDSMVVTGPLSNAEITARTPSGFYLLVPAGYDEHVLAGCGFQVLRGDDTTERMAVVAERRRQVRGTLERGLRAVEGDRAYEIQQEFLNTVAFLACEGRLSRRLFLAAK